MKTFDIYFDDLNDDARARLLKLFDTTEEEENWDICQLAEICREEEDDIS